MTNIPPTQTENTTTVCPASDIVASSVAELRLEFTNTIAAGTRELIVDFSKVNMLDSAGIGLLVAAHNSLSKLQGRLTIVHASPEIVELLRTMRLHRHFEISGD